MSGKLRIDFSEEGSPTATVSGDIPVESQKHLQQLLGWVGVGEIEVEAGGAESSPAVNVPPPSDMNAPGGMGGEMNPSTPTENPLEQMASSEPAAVLGFAPQIDSAQVPAANEAHFEQSGEPGSMGVINQDAGMVPPVQQPAPRPSLNITEEKTPGAIPHGWEVPPGVNEPPSFAQDQFSPANQMNPSMLPVAAPGTAEPIMDVLVAEEQNLPEVHLVQPPRGFSTQQWSQLLPDEQVRYYELQPEMNDAINRHDHEALRQVASEITALQRKMRELPIETYQTQQVIPPPLAHRSEGKSMLSIMPAFDVRLEKAVFKALDLGNPFSDVVKGHQSGEPKGKARGGKYLHREWTGKYWKYHYSENPHPENHGIGEVAVHAASHKQSHSIEIHPGVDKTKHGDAAAAYRSTVRLTARREPEKLTWVKQNRDGSYSVYRQTAKTRTEVAHTKVDSAPDNLASVKPKKGIALSKYKREHVQLKHKDAGSSEASTLQEWRTSEGKVQAILIHKPGSAYPYQIHEFGPKKIVPKGKSYGEYTTKAGAERAMRFHQARSAIEEGVTKPFSEIKTSSKLDPEKYPIAYKIESGQCGYEAKTTRDPLTGHQFHQLVPKLSREEHKSFITGEVGKVIESAVRDVTSGRGLNSEQVVDLVRSCALDAWQACIMRIGGKKIGGFEPGESTNLLGLIRTTLRAQGGSINQWLARNSAVASDSKPGSTTTKEGTDKRGTVKGKAYLSAADWKSKHREAWVDAQKENWLATHGMSLSDSERAAGMSKLSEQLANVKNRNRALRFARENVWADRPLMREVVMGKIEGEEQKTPEQILEGKRGESGVDQWEGFSPKEAMDNAVKDLGSGDKKKTLFLRTMANNFQSTMDGNAQMEAASNKMIELFPSAKVSERQKRLKDWIQEFARHGQVQAAREYLARSLVQPSNGEDSLPRNHPLYSYASGIVMRSSVGSVLKSLSDSLSGESFVKRWFLYKAVAAILDGELDTTWFENQAQETLSVCKMEKSYVSQMRNVLSKWLGELHEDSIFKGIQYLIEAHNHATKAEISHRMGNLWILGAFEKEAVQ